MAIQKDWVYGATTLPSAYHIVRINSVQRDLNDGLRYIDFSVLVYDVQPTSEDTKPVTWVSYRIVEDPTKNNTVQCEDHLLTLPAYAGGVKVA